MYHDIKFPDQITSFFPDAAKEKYSNGVISFSNNYLLNFKALFENHVKPTFDQPMTFLIGFRQYLHYHFHAIKASLHTRMRKRVETFQRVLTKARRD